jgi:hypothetical protein
MRPRRFGPKIRFRVDLHGISAFGPGDRHTLIRFEWVESIEAGDDGTVVVRSSTESVLLPPGAFGLAPADLARRLEEARSIQRRADVIGQLTGR